VYLIYFDEVKNNNEHPYYWLGALVVSIEAAFRLENKLNQLSFKHFDNYEMNKGTEFHASDIFHRKANFKEQSDVAVRIDLLDRLADILSEEKECFTIYVKINVDRMVVADDYDVKAFMFLVEKCEDFLSQKKDYGMLIGDRENEKVAKKFSEILSGYRNKGTPYAHGKDRFEYLIDTVHFSNSEHSRLLQLADFYVWSKSFLHSCNEIKTANKVLKERIKDKIPTASKYKDWPSCNSELLSQIKPE
jgi:hypothetical protein